MQRGSWSEISGDQEIWKKLATISGCFLLVLTAPISLGALYQDLTDENQRIKDKEPPGKLVELDNIPGLFGKGIVPTVIFFLAMMLYCVPTVVVLMSSAQTYAWLKSEHGINYLSFLVTAAFGLLALLVQFLCAILLPIALAQYARGTSLRIAVDPLANFGNAMSMGVPFWIKASGYWAFLLANIILFIQGPAFWVDLPIRVALCVLGFASLVVSSRYALNQLHTKL